MTQIRSFVWLLATLGGLGLMIFSYQQALKISETGNEQYILYIAEQSESEFNMGLRVEVYLLPPDDSVKQIVNKIGGEKNTEGRIFLRNHQEKIILFPNFDNHFSADMLESGRLPKPGEKEVLAESGASFREQIAAGDQDLEVVGVLKKKDSFQQKAYYAADDQALRTAIDPDGKLFKSAQFVPLKEIKAAGDMKKIYPHDKFTGVIDSERMDRNSFYKYTAGMLFFVLGGSALIIQCYISAAKRTTNVVLGPPLAEIRRHWKLLFLVHVAYFGLYLIAMLLSYEIPLIQDLLLVQIRSEIESGTGLLGVAGQAYGSGHIAVAALTTVAINFIAGSLLMITLPSLIIPGIGILVSVVRAAVWGLALSPALMVLSGVMLFHCGTLLMEGEGYILASFFGLLVPIYLFNPIADETIGKRYWRAFMMNLKGNIIVLIILGIAATYEAIEVILQS